MKKLFLFCVSFVWLSHSYSQNNSAEIKTIEKTVGEIQANITNFKKIEKINSAEGFRFVYLSENQLQFIQIRSIETNVDKNVWWYYADGKMIYAETRWTNKDGKVTFTDKVYLNNDRMIKWTNNGEEVRPSSDEFNKMDSTLVAYGKKIRLEALK